MEIKTILNKKIIEFADEHDLNLIGNYGRDCRAREVHYFTIWTDSEIELGRIRPNYSYEQFLETIATNAIAEAERLYDFTDIMESVYDELWEDYAALKEEAADVN